MSAVEMLVVQIFDRKNSIIEQVKRQTELYSQHLASKLVIDGITPPSWLFSPNSSSETHEVDKEILISKLIRQFPQSSVRVSSVPYPMYGNPLVTGYNERFSDRAPVGYVSFDRGLTTHDGLSMPTASSEHLAGCAQSASPEKDAIVISPEGQADERNVNISSAADQSIGGTQRSRSKQKDHQLCNSAKSVSKRSWRHDCVSSKIRFSLSAANHAGQKDELQRVEPVIFDRGIAGQDGSSMPAINGEHNAGSANDDVPETDISVLFPEDQTDVKIVNTLNAADQSIARLQRSKSRQKALEFRNSVKGVSKSSISREKGNVCASSDIRFPLSAANQAEREDEQQRVEEDCVSTRKGFRDSGLGAVDLHSQEKEMNSDSGRISRSRSQQQLPDIVRGSPTRSYGSENCIVDVSSDFLSLWKKYSADDSDPEKVDAGSKLDAGDCFIKDRETDSGRISTSKTSELHTSSDASKANSFDDCQRTDVPIVDFRNDLVQKSVDRYAGKTSLMDSAVHESISSYDKSHEESYAIARSKTSELPKSSDSSKATSFDDCQRTDLPIVDFRNNLVQKSVERYAGKTSLMDSAVHESISSYDKSHEESYAIARSKTSEPHKSSDSSKASTFDDYQRTDVPIVDFRNDLVQQTVDRYAGKISLMDSAVHESISSYDKSHDKSHEIASLGSNPQIACEYLDKQSASSQTDGGILSASSEIAKPGVHDSDMNSALIKSSLDLNGRRTRSQTRSYPKEIQTPVLFNNNASSGGTMFEIDDSHKAGANEDLQNAETSQISQPFHVTHDLHDYHDNVDSVMANELVSYPKDRYGRSFSNGYKQRNEMKIQVARRPSDSSLFVGLHHLNFGRNGEHEFKNIYSSFGQRLLDNSLEKMISSLSCAATSQGGQCCEGNDKFSSESNSCDSKDFRSIKESSGGDSDVIKSLLEQNLKNSSYPECKVFDQFAYPPMDEKETAPCSTCRSSHGDNSSLERMSRHASLELQPKLKVRKIKHRKCQSSSPSPSFWVNKAHSFQRNAPTSMGSISHALMDSSCDLNKGIDIGFRSEMNNGMTEAVGCTFSSPDGEIGFSDELMENKQPRTSLASDLTNEKSSSLGCFVEGLGRNSRSKSDEQNLEISTPTTIEGVHSPEREDKLNTHDYVHSRNEDLETTDIDRSMPLFEGFSVDAGTDGCVLDHIVGGIVFDKLNSSRSTIERASILAEICKSSSVDTPFRFSPAVEFQDPQNTHASANNIQYDRSGFRYSVPSIDASTQLFSATDDLNDSVKCKSYCDFHPFPGEQYGFDLGSRHPSPVGKLWPRPLSYSGSSEKHIGSNPYLMCFPIEEDPSASDDNDISFENADDVQRETDPPLDKNSENRQPLQDLTNLCSNSDAEEEKFFPSDKVFSTKTSISGSQDIPRNCYRTRSVTGERKASSVGANDGTNNLTFSIGTNQIKKVNQSTTSSLSKPIHSSKTSLHRQNENVSLKESKRNNIVSNVSSFIPLIQQKQAAAVGAGKRDGKVKALEAAEAAKRLEEKRQIERNLRKEAMKLKRAKLEENNLRLKELEKRRIEEEHKKKDADKLAKKRLREEDERKEEKKKMRVEQRRHQQRELKVKVRSVKAKEDNQQLKDEKMTKREFQIESEKRQKMEIVRKTDSKSIPFEVVNKDKCSATSQSLKAAEVICRAERSPPTELLVQRSTERSYDISPYQCSDDEYDDDDDNELPTKKHVPSWASKSSVAVHLSLQLEMDADIVFPAKSFCSIDEVLLPRNVWPKTHG